MGKVAVTLIDAQGIKHEIQDIDAGLSLMEISKQNGVTGVVGECGGAAACGTCHLYVDPDWLDRLPEPDSIELDMLEMLEDTRRDNSRLGCQIKLSQSLSGLKATVAPASDY